MSPGRHFSVALIAVVLAGCEAGSDFGDLDAYMAELRLRRPERVEPAPALRTYPAFTYDATNLRSPFSQHPDADFSARNRGVSDVKPNPNRVKQYLEGFNIEQFEMVGTLANARSSFALLRGAGGVHRLQVGDYLGRNDGRVVAISREQVDVIEIVPDGEGAWQERPRILPLKKHS